MHLAVSSPSYFPSVPTHPISPHPHLFTVFPLFTPYLSRVVSILPQNFFTHTLYRADDRAAALIEREKAARYSPRLNEYHNMYLLYCIAKNLPAVEDHRLDFDSRETFSLRVESFQTTRASTSSIRHIPKMANVYLGDGWSEL